MSHNICTYNDYLQLVNSFQDFKMQEQEQELIQKFRGDQTFSARFSPVLYLLDYSTRKYIYVDEGCFDVFGFTATQWKEDGLDGYIKKWHPLDFDIINHKVFPQNMLFIKDLPANRYQDIIFSHNYRTLNAKGEYITIIQRSSFIPGPNVGIPIGNIGAAFDITHFKNDISVIHTIEETKNYNGQPVNEILYKKVHAVEDPEVLPMTRRELEVLLSMSEGLSSKQIASRLNLSIHTINNHRKNMLQKTGCKSSSELLNYALRHGHL